VVRLDTSFLCDSECNVSGFYIPAVVATTISLRDLKDNICTQYPWGTGDSVDFQYFNSTEGIYVPLISNDDLGILFALIDSCRVGKICIHVGRVQASSGVGASSGGGHHISVVLLPLLIMCTAPLLVGPQQYHLSPVLVVARSFLRSMWRTMQRLRICLLKMMRMS
jgi:hypothetical protein